MRLFAIGFAVLVTLGIVAPYATPAMADTVVIHKHHGYFHPHHHDVVIIKHRHHDD